MTTPCKIGCVCIWLLTNSSVWCQEKLPTADSILQDHFEAAGNAMVFRHLDSTQITANHEHPSLGTGLMEFVSKGNRWYYVFKYDTYPNYQLARGFDGKEVWENNGGAPETLTGKRRQMFLEIVPRLDRAPDWLEYDGSIETVGTEIVEGRDCYKIKFSPSDGNPVYRFFDVESKLLTRMTYLSGDQEANWFFDDYRSVDGIMVPFQRISEFEYGKYIVIKERVLLNEPVDETLFQKPKVKPEKNADESAQHMEPAAEGRLPSPETIVRDYIDALGGEMALRGFTTCTIRSEMVGIGRNPSGELQFWSKGDRWLQKLEYEDGEEFFTGFDSKQVWMYCYGTFQGNESNEGRTLSVITQRRLMATVPYVAAPLSWLQFDGSIDFIGRQKVRDRPCYVVKFSPTDGKPIDRYFDAETSLLLRQSFVDGGISEAWFFSEYRNVDGIQIAFKRETHKSNVHVFDVVKLRVSFDDDVDDAVFLRDRFK